jgi:hypothetical protein
VPAKFTVFFAGFAVVLALCTPARAQRPVCVAPGPTEPHHVFCLSDAYFPVVRLISDFTVDHLFKPAPPAFRRTFSDFLAPLAGYQMATHPELAGQLKALELKFTQLDRTTGVLVGDFAKLENASRAINGVWNENKLPLTLQVDVPARVEGGYWRSPDAVQLAFWKGKSPIIKVAADGQTTIGGAVDCLGFSSNGVHVRFRDGATPVMFRARSCR